jgi:fructose-specific phosphotransferase system IIA component
MKICNYIDQDLIFLNARLPDKASVLNFIADVCAGQGIVSDRETLLGSILAREETMSTGIGDGLGLPHAVSCEVKQATVILLRPEKPVDFGAIDNLPVDIIVGMIIPENQTALHIQILAAVSRLCRNPAFPETFRKAGDPKLLAEDILQLESKMAFH